MDPGRSPEEELTPRLAEKAVKIHEVLSDKNIPHAFGGAIAVDYFRVPRATIDIDVSLFIPPEEKDRVIEALEQLFPIPNREQLRKEIAEREQGKVDWGGSRIDLFFSFDPFHDSVARRTREEDFQGSRIPVLSGEDIVIFKVTFDRPGDWEDIREVAKLNRDTLDMGYMKNWLQEILSPDDPRISKLEKIFENPR